MPLRFDLTDLRLVLSVVDTGSITAGAQANHLTPSSASGRILAMERALETPLFLRERRGVQPTAAGRVLARYAGTVLAQADRLRKDVEEHARGMRGHIRLLGTSAAVREYLPDPLGRFLAAHPYVHVSLGEAVSAQTVQAVRDGEADLGLVTEQHDLQGLQSLPFHAASFVIAAPLGHAVVRQARGGAIRLAQADRFDIIGLSEGSPLQDSWEQRAVERGTPLNYRLRVASFDAQARLIERGVGIALMPAATAVRYARSMAIAVVPLSDPYLNRRMLICMRSRDDMPEYTRRLVELLRV
jgi:DNA-binding transcriptional LysR family regulator